MSHQLELPILSDAYGYKLLSCMTLLQLLTECRAACRRAANPY